MFRHRRDYFGEIPCPSTQINEVCRIVNCIFKHNAETKSLKLSNPEKNDQIGSKRSNEGEESTRKRTRVNNEHDDNGSEEPEKVDIKKDLSENEETKLKDISFILPTAISHIEISRTERTINCKKLATLFREKGVALPNRKAIDEELALVNASKSKEDYHRKVESVLNVNPEKVIADPKFILPKEVLPSAPAMLAERKKYIKLLADAFKKADPNEKIPITNAIEEEFKLASTATNNTYVHTVKRRIYDIANFKTTKTEPKVLTDDEFLEKLNSLVIPVDVLAKYGYTTAIPEDKEFNEVRTCGRCKTEFKLKDHLKPSQCYYHSGKMNKISKGNRIYECCGATVGSDADPCAKSEFHVFSWSDAHERHKALPYKLTSEIYGIKNHAFKALGIDCEMGFTTKGFELLRITAIDFFSREEVLDILVRPKGEVIDLNTKWSGIAEIKDEALSFEDSINLLGEVVDQNTILIGHGLENDLNSMRLIHHRVIDTAILYPKHQTSPTFRFSLKHLSFKYLGRTIQTGEHDSSEDSLAAIDIVKYFIRLEAKSST